MNHKRLTNKDWNVIVIDLKKISSWKEKLLSYGGCLVLINSVLSSLPMYMISFFEVPIVNKLDYFGPRIF
jgi:hypothetical protein